jgi:cell wall-associated NlpC family hydrolase
MHGYPNLFKGLLLGLTLLCASMAQGQDMTLQQIAKLYDNGKYEKCINKAEGFIERHPREPMGYLLVAMPNLQLYFVTDGSESDSLLSDAMFYALEARMLDTSGVAMQAYAWEMNELYRVIRERGNELYNSVNKPSSGIYFKYLAQIYSDTTAEFREFYGQQNMVRNVVDIDPNNRSANIIRFAESLMGTPYHYTGTSTQGFDCSGYVCYVFKASNIDLPHGSNSMATMGKTVTLAESRPGDLIFFGTRHGKAYRTSHVAIIHSNDGLGNITFIHSSTSAGVTIDGTNTISWDYWKHKILFVKRIVE